MPSEIIGGGARGTVYMGFDESSGRFVAVKEIVTASDAEAAAVVAEASMMLDNVHRNIVSCLGYELQGERALVFLELMAGGSVGQLIRRLGRLTESTSRRILRDTLTGLTFLHEQCICHRDIKPDNLLLTASGVCKLGDFGTSKTIPRVGILESCAGTPNYMAPEVVSGAGYADSADMWSVGCCALEMLTGEPLFHDCASPAAVLFRLSHLSQSPEIPAAAAQHLSPQALQFIQACLLVEPNGRPTAAQLLDHPWLHVRTVNCGISAQSVRLFALEDSTFCPPSPASSAHTNGVAPGGSWRSLIPNCQSCDAPATMECDACRRGGRDAFRLCPSCWESIHNSASLSGHVKRPLLAPSCGVLLNSGAFVDGVDGHSCGRCAAFTSSKATQCHQCGHFL